MTEIRCQRCNGLLLMAAGSIDTEIKCRTCKYLNKIKMADVASEVRSSKINETALAIYLKSIQMSF